MLVEVEGRTIPGNIPNKFYLLKHAQKQPAQDLPNFQLSFGYGLVS
jgi:hypothetical protein